MEYRRLVWIFIGADCVVNSLVAIERETCVISSITDQVPFLEYKDLCNEVCEAFPDLASLAEDLKKDDNDGNLLDLDSDANCIIHI